jgi:putative transposase
MARLPRIVVPGQPLHIVQRGNNRVPCFFGAADYHYYLDCLAEAAGHFGCHIHAYVLMTNHVHLLLTPETSASPSLTLQSVGRRYVRYVNRYYRRSGTLWEGRYKSALIDSEHYLLTCSRYLDLNPVRAKMVRHPRDYPWSSYCSYAEGAANSLITAHPLYLQLGTSTESRCAAYRALFANLIGEAELSTLRVATNTGAVLGNNRFRAEIESTLQRKVTRLAVGGDRKSAAFKARCSPVSS